MLELFTRFFGFFIFFGCLLLATLFSVLFEDIFLLFGTFALMTFLSASRFLVGFFSLLSLLFYWDIGTYINVLFGLERIKNFF